ncbi:Hsp20/alpha crystallin family protein [Sporolactobacillus shoreicorticis]|uniref:Hsp20/alpha crystallin family protein n=1 Tax=Sporolactobacillus shoreicorticis TaxID=1923877 RepID=A0ABW5S7E4_9BACL|nr:Hsp20/alpha crystallin family protein [Sporolactobacillus shoreicorticis]MCO7125530.1 Hsp20/alpha crystallin family protein [Sporolactobacillus shoreicorticis]
MDSKDPREPQQPKRRNLMNDLDAFFQSNPFGDVLKSIDDFFSNHSFTGFPVRLYDTNDEWVVEAELPGADRDSIRIELLGDKVKIAVDNDVEMESQHQETGVYSHERRFDHAERVVTLPYSINRARTQASYTNGILKIHGPKSPKTGHNLSID